MPVPAREDNPNPRRPHLGSGVREDPHGLVPWVNQVRDLGGRRRELNIQGEGQGGRGETRLSMQTRFRVRLEESARGGSPTLQGPMRTTPRRRCARRRSGSQQGIAFPRRMEYKKIP